MSNPDPLKAMFDVGAAPVTDPGFRMDVMTKVAYRRLWTSMAQRAFIFVLIGIAAFLAAPAIGNALALPLVVYLALGGAALLAFAGQYLVSNSGRLSWPSLKLF